MNRPKVVVCQSASLDGRLTLSPDTLLLYGDERWSAMMGSSDRDFYAQVKAAYQPQVILEGSGSFMLEGMVSDPLPPVGSDPASLRQDFLPEAVVNRPGHRGWFTVVDSRGRGALAVQGIPRRRVGRVAYVDPRGALYAAGISGLSPARKHSLPGSG